MALFKSQVLTQASGSVGGLTYSHTSSGLYMRGRAIPVNPNTSQQTIVRGAVTTLVERWSLTLTEQQRNSWNIFAANVLVTNALGSAFQQSGQNAFVQANVARVAAGNGFYTPLTGLPLIPATATPSDNAPSEFNFAETGEVQLVGGTVNNQTVTVGFDAGQAWANEVGGALLVYIGRPRNASRTFFKGPYRLLGAIIGDDTTPPTSPASLITGPTAFGFNSGQNLTLKVVAIRAQGTLTGAPNPPVVSSSVTTNSAISTLA